MTLPYEKSHIEWNTIPIAGITFWDYVAAKKHNQKSLILTASLKRDRLFCPIAAMKLKKLK